MKLAAGIVLSSADCLFSATRSENVEIIFMLAVTAFELSMSMRSMCTVTFMSHT